MKTRVRRACELTRAVGTAFALTQIKNGRSLNESLERYHAQDDQIALAAIRHVYDLVLPGGSADDRGVAEARARKLLDNYILTERPGSFADVFRDR